MRLINFKWLPNLPNQPSWISTFLNLPNQPRILKSRNILKTFLKCKIFNWRVSTHRPWCRMLHSMFLLFSFPSCLMSTAILSYFPLNGTLLDKSTYFQLYLPNELWQISTGRAEVHVQGRILLLRQLQDGLHRQEHRLQFQTIQQHCSWLRNK